jgi:hypothetical protein
MQVIDISCNGVDKFAVVRNNKQRVFPLLLQVCLQPKDSTIQWAKRKDRLNNKLITKNKKQKTNKLTAKPYPTSNMFVGSSNNSKSGQQNLNIKRTDFQE